MTYAMSAILFARAKVGVTGLSLCVMVLLSYSAALAESPTSALMPLEPTEMQGRREILQTDSFLLSTVRTPGRYTLHLRNSAGQTGDIVMPDTPWDIAVAAPAIDGKAVVDLAEKDGGGPDFGTNTIFILGSNPPALLDHFLCDMPTLSPDGKMLSFVAWYPPHFAPEKLTSNFVMLYDLTRPAMANRNAPRTDFPLSDLPDRRVGLQVYPVPSGQVRERAPSAMHEVYDLTWSPDSTKLLFSDEVNSDEDEVNSNETDQSSKTSELGNIRPSAKTSSDIKSFLVLVEVQGHTLTVKKTTIHPCPVISGISCVIDVRTAVFGSNDVVVRQHIRGQVNKDVSVRFSYGSFAVVR